MPGVAPSPVSPSPSVSEQASNAFNTNLPDFSGNPFVSSLIGPASQMASTVGPGQFEKGSDPSQMLQGSMQAMNQVLEQGMQVGGQLIGSFAGVAAQALGQFAGMAGQALSQLATRSGQMGTNVGQASESTSRAATMISIYLQQFQHISEALIPLIGLCPPAAAQLIEEASRTTGEVSEATAQLESELGADAATMTGPMMADVSQPATPSTSAVQPAMSAMQSGIQGGTSALSGIGSGMTQAMSSLTGGIGQIPQALTGLLGGAGGGAGGAAGGGLGALGSASGVSGLAATTLSNPFTGAGHASSAAGGMGGMSGVGSAGAGAAKMLLDPRTMGKGAQLFLPDGSTSQAPNAAAANAVRHALSQVGVPYEWGGTKPGVGLDCSGLTQWAYQESGVDLPRLAQEQGVGTHVDAGSVMPGDLAVWDGHVAMVIGNGMMVEAGDPVQISPIRTTNAGQGFHGFFRPTS